DHRDIAERRLGKMVIQDPGNRQLAADLRGCRGGTEQEPPLRMPQKVLHQAPRRRVACLNRRG
ncbi:MAG: hypothetical protein ACK5DR_06190, partial [Planctomyces sp.]